MSMCMLEKVVVIVRGTCGAGKSHWIEQQWRNEITDHIDFADMLDLVWHERPAVAVELARKSDMRLVFIEGIFGPDAPTYNIVRESLRNASWVSKVKEIIIHRSKAECIEGIRQGPEDAIENRIKLCDIYWEQFEDHGFHNKLREIPMPKATLAERKNSIVKELN